MEITLKKLLLTILLIVLSLTLSYGQTNSIVQVGGGLSATTDVNSDILKAIMISPLYRNAIYATMDSPDSIKIKLSISNAVFLASSTVDVTLSRDSIKIKDWEITTLSQDMVISLAVSDITFENTRSAPYTKDDNPYHFKIEVKEDGTVKAEVVLELNKYPAPPNGVNEVRIDDDHNLVINGKREFIFGTYLYSYESSWYSYLESIGINGFMEYGSRLNNHSDSSWGIIRTDLGGKEDIERARQEFISYRGKSNLLGYRLVDEPNSHGPSPDIARGHYQAAKEEDPYHPAIIVLVIVHHPGYETPVTGYTNCADLFMLDIYPIYKNTSVSDEDISMVSKNYKYMRNHELGRADWEHEELPLFSTFQMFNMSHWIMPHTTEIKNMVYQNLAGGARSFFPYTYNGEYNDKFEYYAQTIKPEVISIMDAVQTKASSSGITVSTTDDSRIEWSHRVTEDSEYLFLLNTSSKWNMKSNAMKKEITINITFENDGSDIVEAVIRDSDMPKSYSISGNTITVMLDGVDETSSGTLVLKRLLDNTLFVSTTFTPVNSFSSGVEGPAVDSEGNLYAVNYGERGTIGIVTSGGVASKFLTLADGSIGNGIRFNSKEDMFIADYKNHNILKVNMTSKNVEVFAHNSGMNQPNDIAITDDDVIYASDPNWGNNTGNLWMIDTLGTTHLLASNMGTTNGVEVSPDNKTLYVNESVQNRVLAFDILSDGTVNNKRVLKQYDDGSVLDGMRCDSLGNIYIACYNKGKVYIISPLGEAIREVELIGTNATNIAFGGPDGKTCYVTVADNQNIETFRTDTPGRSWVMRKKLTGVERDKANRNIPSEYLLLQNYPNPFNPSTVISFALPKSGNTELGIYNILGEKVATLVTEVLSAGLYSYEFDASSLSSGIYFYKLQSNNYVSIKKMMLIK